MCVTRCRIEGLGREKQDLMVQYAKHWEIAHQLNSEVNKLNEIVARYQVWNVWFYKWCV